MGETMNDIYDIAIIGGGPAGLSAALTARIRGKKVALFEHLDFSRKLQRAHDVDNYLGMPHRTGTDIMREMADHALAHEPDVIREKVISVFPGKKNFTIACKEEMYTARTVILATGVTSGALFEGEKQLLGKGVSYCATCDGMFFRGKTVAVISYGKEGEADAAYLANLCKEVYYLPQYRDEMNLRADNIIVENVMPRRIEGQNKTEKLITSKGEMHVDGVFIIRESDPVENLVRGLSLDGTHIAVDRQMRTNINGLYACGDCTGKPYQVSKAVGEGLVAALSAVEYLHEQESTAEA
ncbi:MAG: FAD-dependent oxidoreductase [Selenomonadales bacterium]|nr:FAD-dependent oxidoreductase [Selenomonadales bacterium]